MDLIFRNHNLLSGLNHKWLIHSLLIVSFIISAITPGTTVIGTSVVNDMESRSENINNDQELIQSSIQEENFWLSPSVHVSGSGYYPYGSLLHANLMVIPENQRLVGVIFTTTENTYGDVSLRSGLIFDSLHGPLEYQVPAYCRAAGRFIDTNGVEYNHQNICNLFGYLADGTIFLNNLNGFPGPFSQDMVDWFQGSYSGNWSARIQWIYYGIPDYYSLLNRSTLSSNHPKNGNGDTRECAINGCSNASATAGDPIDTRTGNFDYSLVDLTLQTIAGPLTFQRSYASQAIDPNLYPTNLAPGWTHNQDTRLIFEPGVVWLKAHTQNQYQFKNNGDQTYSPYAGVLASLTFNPGNGTYMLKASDQSIYTFNSEGRVLSWRNELGYGFDYYYNSGNLYRVIEPVSGRYIQLEYQNGQIVSVKDQTNRTISYGYNGNGDLVTFTDTRNKTWIYGYDGTSHHLNILNEPSVSTKTILSVHYDELGRADEQFNGKGERITKIIYNLDETSTILDSLDRQSTHVHDGRNTNVSQSNTANYLTFKNYDNNFRTSQVLDSDGRTINYQWSPDGANLTYVKDAAGYETSLVYNTRNHVTSVTDPRDQVTDFIYEGALLTSSVRHTTQSDITTTYTYTTSADAPQPIGLVKTVTDPLAHTTSFTYYPSGELETATNAEIEVTHFTYTATGLVENVTDPLGRVTHYIYDETGNISTVIRNYDESRPVNDENQYNLTDEYRYDDQGRLEFMINTLGHSIQYIYNDAGQIWKEIHPEGQITTYEYNTAGQLTDVIDPLGHKTTYVYDPTTGWLTHVKDNLGRVMQAYNYNPDGTVHIETTPTPEGDYTITYETYDPLKRPTRIIDNEGRWNEVSYDAYGNPLTRTDALGRVTKYEYNDLGLLKSVVENFKENPLPEDDPNATNVRTEYSYDAVGNLKSITDANNHTTLFNYDPLNRLGSITDHLANQTSYQYDSLLNKKSVTDNNGNTIDYYYDLADRLNIIDYPGEMPDVDFDYDPLGRMTDMIDSLGHTQWVYDDLNRIISITDPFTRTVGYGYDADSKRTNITYPSSLNKTITYQYNTLDQLENVLEGTTLLAHYTYDTANRLSSISRSNDLDTTYDYTLSGRLEGLTHQNSASQLASYHYKYDLAGNIDWVDEQVVHPHFSYLPLIQNQEEGGLEGSGELPEGDSGLPEDIPWEGYPAPLEEGQSQFEAEGTEIVPNQDFYPTPDASVATPETTFFHQVLNALTRLFDSEIRNVSANSALFSDYPPPGIQEVEDPPAENHRIDYSYDALNRLTGAVYTEGPSYAYKYDKVGNRISQIINGGETVYQYDELNRLTNAGSVAFTWDANGNLLNDGENAYTYDIANRLTELNGQGTTFSFAYDGLGNRYQQTANGETTTYLLDLAGDLSQVLYDDTTAYFYGLDRLAQQVNGGDYEYFLPDRLGSVRQVAGESGFPSFAQEFDPYGNLTGYEGMGGSSYGFTGELGDPSGLTFLRARYYSPAQGRFITRDPFPGYMDRPASFNPYSYALNNPVLYTDPSGKNPFAIIAGLGFAAGAILDAYQQTNGFTNFCDFDIFQTLSAGIGGAAAATSIAIFSVMGIGFIGMGLQGLAMGLSWLGFSAPLYTSIFIAGLSVGAFANAATAWLFYSSPPGKDIPTIISQAATKAKTEVGPGSGPVYGTNVHTEFAQEINSLSNPELNTEISYLNGEVVKYGKPGSIRVDVVFGLLEDPIAIFDLKTGNAILTHNRFLQIQDQLPHSGIPIIEVR